MTEDELRAALDRLAAADPAARRAAADLIFANCTEADAPRIGARIADILPDRRALATAIDRLRAAIPEAPERLLPVVRAVLASLAEDRLTTTLQVLIAVPALPWSELGTLLEALAAEGGLHSDALAAATIALCTTRRTDLDGLAALEMRLFASPDRYLRRLGLAALIGLSQAPRGWDAGRLERLRAYRADAAAIVAAAAQFTFPDGSAP